MESIDPPSHFHITTLWNEDGEYDRDVYIDHSHMFHLESPGNQSFLLAKTAPPDSCSRHSEFLANVKFYSVLFHTGSTWVVVVTLCKRGYPLFEELLFRDHIYAIQQHLHRHTLQIVVMNALLFAVWHLGYIMHPLWCGEWMALSKLIVGFLYGLLLAYIRSRTQSTVCCILTHGAMNSFFG